MGLRLERRCPMCFKVKQEYYRREEARRALEVEQKKKQEKPAVPAKPVEADRPSEQPEPVPV
jgi:hypothetical protein